VSEPAYTVFVDESFYKWFGLPSDESNFCYAALSIPTARLPDLQKFEASLRIFLRDKLPADIQAKVGSGELKYTHLRHADPATIDTLGEKFAYFLKKNGCSIFGYFIPAGGYLNYRIRSDFIDDLDGLKALSEAERKAKVQVARDELLQKSADAEHNLGLLTDIYNAFSGFVLNHHGKALRKTYRIVYDGRNPAEDEALLGAAEEVARLTDRISPGIFEHYKGYQIASSADTPGLRLVDWFAGDIRAFFYRSAPVQSAVSSYDILSPYLNPKMTLIGHGPYYQKALPPEVTECFTKKGQRLMMPSIKDFFASGIITYYAEKGEARQMVIPLMVAFDLAD
jgi:hypothetical protein